MFGGILDIAKESDEIYIFHIPTSKWKLIDMLQGPFNLDQYFEQKDQPKTIVKKKSVDMNDNKLQINIIKEAKSIDDL